MRMLIGRRPADTERVGTMRSWCAGARPLHRHRSLPVATGADGFCAFLFPEHLGNEEALARSRCPRCFHALSLTLNQPESFSGCGGMAVEV